MTVVTVVGAVEKTVELNIRMPKLNLFSQILSIELMPHIAAVKNNLRAGAPGKKLVTSRNAAGKKYAPECLTWAY